MDPQINPIITKYPNTHRLPDFDAHVQEDVFKMIINLNHSQDLNRFSLHRTKLSLAKRYTLSMDPYIYPQQSTRSRLKTIRAYFKRIPNPYLNTNEDFIRKINQEILRQRWISNILTPTTK